MAEFDRFADSYRTVLDQGVAASGESSEYFADYKARWLASRLGHGFAGRILDYGCGVGLLTACLLRHLPAARCTGFDVSSDSIAAVPADVAGGAQFTSDLREIDSDFQLIVLSNVLHHVPATERDALIQTLVGRLAPGGELAVFEHNPGNPATRLVVSRCPFDHDAVLLWPGETRARLRRAGLGAVAHRYVVFFPRPLARLRRLEPMIGWLPLGAQYVASGVRS